MALLAEDARDRAEQLLLVTERLTRLIEEETARIEARQPPLEGAEADEKNRLANAYRLELARIRQDVALIADAPPELLRQLRKNTEVLHNALARHELALNAVKMVAEGLVQAMAEEVVRQRGGGANYDARGAKAGSTAPSAALVDRSA